MHVGIWLNARKAPIQEDKFPVIKELNVMPERNNLNEWQQLGKELEPMLVWLMQRASGRGQMREEITRASRRHLLMI